MYKAITWDWKDETPLEEILTAVQEMIPGRWFYSLPDTGGDYFACIISDHPVGSEEAESILENSA